jgi:hypothetical protein
MKRRDILRTGCAGLVTTIGAGLAGCSGDSGSDNSEGDDGGSDGSETETDAQVDADSPEGVIESYYRMEANQHEDGMNMVLHSDSWRRPVELDDEDLEMPTVETEILEEDLDAQDIGFELSWHRDYSGEIAEELAEMDNAWVEATLTYEDDDDTNNHLVVVEDGNWQLWY